MKNIKKNIKSAAKRLSLAREAICEDKEEHETDFSKWTQRQSRHLKRREFSQLDIDNLIEELEGLGRSEKRALKSYIEVFLMHLLKIQFQPKKRTISWDLSIKEAKYKAQSILQENPSLQPKLKELIKEAYFYARIKAALETGLNEDKFPEECPWTVKDLFPSFPKKYS
jgi:hypothetical protein